MAQSTTEQTTVARPYAEAVFKRAKETEQLGAWSDMLPLLASVVGDPRMLGLISNPRVQPDQLTSLILDVTSGQLSEEGQNLVRLLVANGRTEALPEIARLFEDLRAEDQGTIEVKVYSAYSVDAAQKKKIASALSERLGKEVSISTERDESLLGGILIRAGDLVIDGSVLGRLRAMSASLNR